MTTETKSTFTSPFYLFAYQEGKTGFAGVAFRHKKGRRFYLILKDARAFPPQAQPPKGRRE